MFGPRISRTFRVGFLRSSSTVERHQALEEDLGTNQLQFRRPRQLMRDINVTQAVTLSLLPYHLVSLQATLQITIHKTREQRFETPQILDSRISWMVLVRDCP